MIHKNIVTTALIVTTSIGLLPLLSSTAKAEHPAVEAQLFNILQNLNLAEGTLRNVCSLRDPISCNGVRASNCEITLVYHVHLQDLLTRRLLSPRNRMLAEVLYNIRRLRWRSGCS